MSKFKFDIPKKNLSWEKFTPKLCDYINCKNGINFYDYKISTLL